MFPFVGAIHAKSDGQYRWTAVSGARVLLRQYGGQKADLGLASPDSAIVIRQGDEATHASFALRLVLQPYQLEMLEALRDSGNMNFVLTLLARGGLNSEPNSEQVEFYSELHIEVPESSWINLLNASKADRILLFEVRMPALYDDKPQHPAFRHLNNAHRRLIEGNWRDCISECRQFAEELGGKDLEPAIERLKTGRRSMTKQEREAVLLAALQHYCHPAVHSKSKHGVLDYERSDATLALSMAASLASYQPSPLILADGNENDGSGAEVDGSTVSTPPPA